MDFSAIPVAVLLAVTLAANLTASVIQTKYSHRCGGGMSALYFYTAASAAVSTLAVFLLSGCRMRFSAFTVWLALLFGAVICLQQLTLLLALSKGPLSYTMVIVSMSTLITALSGVLFWQESLRPLQLVGIALMLLCLFLSVKKEPKTGEQGGAHRLSLRWLCLSLLSMAFNGAVGILQKTHQTSAHKEELPAFLLVAFAFCAVFSLLCCCFLHYKGKRAQTRSKTNGRGQAKSEAGGIAPSKSKADSEEMQTQKSSRLRFVRHFAWIFPLAGICTALCHCINLYLSGVLAAAIFFPIVNGGALMLTTIASRFLFRERLALSQWLGLALGAVATLLLCL